jgi:hypothetical protein
VESVNDAGPDGVSSGILYTALSGQGCSLRQYEQIINALVASGRLRASGNRLYAA